MRYSGYAKGGPSDEEWISNDTPNYYVQVQDTPLDLSLRSPPSEIPADATFHKGRYEWKEGQHGGYDSWQWMG